jgi:hypothetical protein
VPEWNNYNNESTLVICNWDAASNKWIISGSSPQQRNGTVITVYGIDAELMSFSKWTLGSTNEDNSLPVMLVSFAVTNDKKGINLTWTTGSELDNRGFEIWRREESDDIFSLISSFDQNVALQGLGTSSFGKTYSFFDTDVQPSRVYTYKLNDVSYNGERFERGLRSIIFSPETEDENNLTKFPETLHLGQNFPNPFNPETTIKYQLPAAVYVELEVFDINGQSVIKLVSQEQPAGYYSVNWQARHLASGFYICRLRAGDYYFSRKMELLR